MGLLAVGDPAAGTYLPSDAEYAGHPWHEGMAKVKLWHDPAAVNIVGTEFGNSR